MYGHTPEELNEESKSPNRGALPAVAATAHTTACEGAINMEQYVPTSGNGDRTQIKHAWLQNVRATCNLRTWHLALARRLTKQSLLGL